MTLLSGHRDNAHTLPSSCITHWSNCTLLLWSHAVKAAECGLAHPKGKNGGIPENLVQYLPASICCSKTRKICLLALMVLPQMCRLSHTMGTNTPRLYQRCWLLNLVTIWRLLFLFTMKDTTSNTPKSVTSCLDVAIFCCIDVLTEVEVLSALMPITPESGLVLLDGWDRFELIANSTHTLLGWLVFNKGRPGDRERNPLKWFEELCEGWKEKKGRGSRERAGRRRGWWGESRVPPWVVFVRLCWDLVLDSFQLMLKKTPVKETNLHDFVLWAKQF